MFEEKFIKNAKNLLMFNNQLEKQLVQMGADIKAIAHKVGNIGNNVNNLTDIVYTDKDSLSNRMLIVSERVRDIQEEIHDHNKALEAQHFRITKLEKETSELSRDSERRAKLINMILTAVISCLIPMVILGSITIIKNENIVERKEVIIKND